MPKQCANNGILNLVLINMTLSELLTLVYRRLIFDTHGAFGNSMELLDNINHIFRHLINFFRRCLFAILKIFLITL